ncbi:hypothetical protein BCR35DRAFT_350894 [Leucosporidium creatinivorum]|uniref:Zn(2)-C6 fungal-type domain-containing protein n=1 Tax=Leucosporidium creatinivorum TaxID=106004 RepID=A0A1Y2FX74_9BASI|nr:hypothetical protein BCR35DRAFT_350894 [Leucosporidium creatinivorum]
MDGDSPAGDGGPPNKRQRVTKACDQCRKRRVKCEAYPDAELGAPCRICTEAGTAAGCTFTRPSKKRGPQAGYAKNLAEKISAFERLLGHLILVHPPTLTVCETFFSPTCTTSASEQTTAFNSSTLPNQLESHPLLKGSPTSPADSLDKTPHPPPPPPPAAPPAPHAHASSSAMSVEDRMSIKDPWSPPALSANGMSPSALSAVGGSGSSTTPTLLAMGGQRPVLGSSSTHSQPPPPPPPQQGGGGGGGGGSMPYFGGTDHAALQTLASAAVPDHQEFYASSYGGMNGSNAFAGGGRAMEIEGVTGNGLGLTSTGSNQMEGVVLDDGRNRRVQNGSNPSSSAPTIPSLPPEAIRNQLLDLYFNQIVHPSYPMLDKSRFFRWSAHLPTQNAHVSVAASTLPPELFLAVYASVVPYLPPTSAKLTHSAEVFAEAGRQHLYHSMHEARLETVQACVLLALCDWGMGELSRAWALSCLSIALSINLSLHISLPTSLPDPDSIRLKTFHSTLILHTLLSLRLHRPPIIVLEDYDIPLPPIDGAENFELWRSDKSAAVLRSQHGLPESGRTGGGGQSHAVRSCALSTFSKMSSLCAIGLSILRWGVCPRRGNGQGLAVGEQERQELVNSLQAWEQDLPTDLRLSEQMRGVEKVEERSRHTIELHLVLFMLYLRLTPHSSFSSSFDPVPQALALLAHLISQYRDLFTFLRSLPTVEGVLHGLSRSLFLSADYTPQQHDAPLRAYEELAMVFPIGKTSFDALRGKVDDHRRELGLVRGIHPTPTTSTSLLPPSPSPAGASEPFQAFLNYSSDLGPSANPSTILDFGSWDQSDLLVSLGLVSGGGELAGGWGLPAIPNPPAGAGEAQREAPLPLPVEGEAGFAYGMPAGTNGAPAGVGGGGGAGASVQMGGADGSPAGAEAAMVMNWPPPPPEPSFSPQATFPQQQPTDLLSRWIGRGELGFGAGEGPAGGGAS